MKYLEKAKGFLRVALVRGRRLAGKARRRAGRVVAKLEAKLPPWALQEWASIRHCGQGLLQWRQWSLSQWLVTVGCVLVTLAVLVWPEPFPSSRRLFLLKLMAVAVPLPAALVLQFLCCRASSSKVLRGFAAGAAFSVFILGASCSWYFLTEKRRVRERLVHACITEPSRECVNLVRRHKRDVDRLPEDLRAEMLGYANIRSGSRLFEDLTPKNQAFVRETYKELLAAQEKKDFQAMFDKARIILSLVDEYNDTKSYEAIAKRGLDLIEEEKRRRALEERQRLVREEVAKLEEKARLLGVTQETQQRLELKALIGEIFQRDPDNRVAAELKSQLEARVAYERRIASASEMARLVAQGKKLFPRAVRSPGSRPELQRIAGMILQLEPGHALASEWRSVIAQEEIRDSEARVRKQAALARQAIAELEIRGERLLGPAHRDAKARAELYEVMERLSQLDQANPYPGSWRRTLQKHLQ